MKIKTEMFSIAWFFLILMLFFVAPLNAATYYVDQNHPQASDSNPGTEELSWKTINKAAQTLQKGDTVLIKQGEYHAGGDPANWQTPALNPANSGTQSSPITFKAYPGHWVKIRGNPRPVGSNGKDYIVWDGFILESGEETLSDRPKGEGGVRIYNAIGVVIQNCEIIGRYVPTTDNHCGINLNTVENITIRNCIVHGFKGDGHNSAGFLSYFTKHITIENCLFYDCNVGIFVKANNYDYVIRKNIIRDCPSHSIFLHARDTEVHAGSPWDGSEEELYTRIYQNIIANCSGSSFYIKVLSHTGAYLSDWRHTLIWNNVFYKVRFAITPEGSPDLQIWNNIFWIDESTDYSILFGRHRTTAGPDVNIPEYCNYNSFYPPNKTKWRVNWYGADQAEYYSLQEWQNAENLDQSSFESNPLFVNAGAYDFHLLAGSLCLNAGIDRQDYDGDGDTTEGINMGCYITGDEIIGPIPQNQGPVISNESPPRDDTNVARNTNIEFDIADTDGVNQGSISVRVNDTDVTSSCNFTAISNGFHVLYDPLTNFGYDSVITVSIDAQDLYDPPNAMNTTWSFTTKGLLDVENFTPTPGDRQVALSWTIPDDEDYAGVEIRCFASSDTNYDEYPGTHEEGELVCKIDTPGNNCLHTKYNGQPLVNGYRYNYSAFSYDLYGNYGTTSHGYAIPTSSGTYTKVFGDATDSDHPGTLEDTFINLNEENSSTYEYVNTYTWPQDKVANAIIMKWDLSVIPSSATIQSATLHLYLSDMQDGGGDDLYDLTVHKIINYNPVISACTGYTYNGTNSWTPNNQCYNDIPLAQADIAAAEDTKSIDKIYGYKSWSVTNMVQDWVSNQGSNYGMLVNSDTVASSDSNRFFSATESSNPDQRPKLVVTYTLGNVAPTASASATPTSSTAPLAVSFTGSGTDSDGTIVSYSWNFGDDGTSTSQNPAHTYNSEGNYTATLTVTDNDGATGSDTVAISVASPPDTINPTVTIAQPTSADTYITDQSTITLSGTASDNVGVTSVTWTNSRGGEGPASGTDTWIISNILLQEGDNVITVTALDAAGNTGTDTLTVTYTLLSGTYTEVFGDATDSDYPGTLQDTNINLNTTNYSSDNLLNTYTWPQDKVANAIVMKWDLSAIPSSATIQSATLYLYLSNMQDGGGDDLYDLTVHKIIHYNPVISACTGHTYNGTNSWTPNNQCYDDIPLAQADIAAAEDTKSIDKTYGYKSWSVINMVQDWVSNQDSNYGMLVNSDAVAGSDSNRFFSATEYENSDQRPKLVVTYSVGNVPPTASASANPTSGTAPLSVTFTGSGTDSDGTIVSYSWNFGDGASSDEQNPSHTYNSEGDYTATLTVTDDDGATDSASATISVSSRATVSVYIQAESGTLESPMLIGDLDPKASGGKYVYAPSGSGDTTDPTAEAVYNIEIPNAGDYYLWLRMHGPTGDNDAMYIGFNDNFDRVYVTQWTEYEWVRVETEHGSGVFAHTLSAGTNQINIGHGKELARVDIIFVTNNPDRIPFALIIQ